MRFNNRRLRLNRRLFILRAVKEASGSLSLTITRHLFGCKTSRFPLENLPMYRNVELTGASKKARFFAVFYGLRGKTDGLRKTYCGLGAAVLD
jgi:hypothetical protein